MGKCIVITSSGITSRNGWRSCCCCCWWCWWSAWQGIEAELPAQMPVSPLFAILDSLQLFVHVWWTSHCLASRRKMKLEVYILGLHRKTVYSLLLWGISEGQLGFGCLRFVARFLFYFVNVWITITCLKCYISLMLSFMSWCWVWINIYKYIVYRIGEPPRKQNIVHQLSLEQTTYLPTQVEHDSLQAKK